MLKVSNLTGFGGARGAEPATTLTQVASATAANSTTIVCPGTVQAGDLLVLWDRSEQVAAPPVASVIPAGFTSINDQQGPVGGFAHMIMSCKIADGSEAGANLTGMSGTEYAHKALYVFRGDKPISAINIQDSSSSDETGSNPAAIVLNASGGAVPLVVLAGYTVYQGGGGTIVVDPRSFSPAKDGEINPHGSLYLAYKIYNTSPADVTIDMDDEGGENCLTGCFISCS